MSATLSLFSANTRIGYSSAETPDFATCADLLTFMDRLGIDRALAWHVAARDLHPRWGNTRLLEEIAATPGAAGRIIPSLGVTPTLLHERGSLDWLRDTMDAHGIRAVRFAMNRGNWALSDLAPVIDAVLPQQPVLVIDQRDPLQKGDILDFAQSYPRVPVIVTQAMWPHYVPLFDLMRRCDNIYVETSWLHTHETLDLLTRAFGAHRVLFGTGFKAHHGAAIASLQNADLDDDTRAAIAYGNLDRLLGTAGTRVSHPHEINSYWSRLLANEPLGVPCIDAHGHFGPTAGWVTYGDDTPAQAAQMLGMMDRIGVETMIISGMEALFTDPLEGNRALEDALAPYGGRFLGYLSFNPFYGDSLAAAFDDFFSRPFFIGFKLLCDYWRVPVTDGRFTPVWEYAHAHRLPILLHTWEGSCDAPEMLRDIAPAYPDAAFLLGHSGGGIRKPAIALAQANPNVYLEWCGSFTTPEPWEDALAQVSPSQIVFGTDAIAHDINWELGRLLSQPFPADAFPAILGGNMRALLNQRKSPVSW